MTDTLIATPDPDDIEAALRRRIETIDAGIANMQAARHRHITALEALTGHTSDPTRTVLANMTGNVTQEVVLSTAAATGNLTRLADHAKKTTPAGKATSKRAESMRAKAAQKVTCPDCGLQVSAMGLGPHKAARHQKPPPPRGIVEHLTRDDFAPDTLHLECDDCDAAFHTDQGQKLVTHTLAEHGRGPRTREKTPTKGRTR